MTARVEARLEALAAVGALAWERWVASSAVSHGPATIVADPARLDALRPYRCQVVRLILEAIEAETGTAL